MKRELLTSDSFCVDKTVQKHVPETNLYQGRIFCKFVVYVWLKKTPTFIKAATFVYIGVHFLLVFKHNLMVLNGNN